MDNNKKAEFVRAFGKKRLKFAKGGQVKRKKFADGGTTLSGPTDRGTQQNATNPNTGFLGSIGGSLGLNNNFQATGANIQAGTNTEQLNQAYQGAQGALGNQQNLVNQLNPGVGSGVQSQNELANQYLAMTQGGGPNPALAQLNQATQQNINNQAALMAGQRGASANAGLIARQAAQQGAQTQQQAVGQAATLEAQQAIAAQQNLENLAAQQVSQAGQAVTGLNSAQQNEQALLQNANTAFNNANVGIQSNINSTNAQTAAANQNMASNIFGGIGSAVSALTGGFLAKGGVVENHHLKLAEMNAHSLIHTNKFAEGGEVGNGPDLGTFKASTADASAPDVASTASLPAASKSSGGSGIDAVAKLAPLAMAAMADGGPIGANPLLMQTPGATVSLGQGQFNPGSTSGGPSIASTSPFAGQPAKISDTVDKLKKKNKDTESVGEDPGWDLGGGMAGGPGDEMGDSFDPFGTMMAAHGGVAFSPGHFERYFAKGGEVPALVSAGEIYLSPEQVDKVLKEDVDPKAIGHKFNGKAKVKGDSYKNDTIPATLREGGVVIDRDHMGSAEKRKLFVHKAMAKKQAGGRL